LEGVAAINASEDVIFDEQAAGRRKRLIKIGGDERAHVRTTANLAGGLRGGDKISVEQIAKDAAGGGFHDFIRGLFVVDLGDGFV
jgi:hypothetical protein